MLGPVRRQQMADGMVGLAQFSPCGRYRYLLERQWNPATPLLIYVMLNPSTADEAALDPTVKRCLRRAIRNCFGRLRVFNLFAFRATHPADLIAAAAPIGPDNDEALLQGVNDLQPDDRLVCAWGNHGSHLNRATEVTRALRDLGVPLHHLGLTQQGAPCHPLYVPDERALTLWQIPE